MEKTREKKAIFPFIAVVVSFV